MKNFYKTTILTLICVFALCLQSCDDRISMDDITPSESRFPSRVPTQETRHGFILYSAGFNSLSSYLRSDIQDLKEGYLPSNSRNDDVLIVVSRLPVAPGDYTQDAPPVVIRMYRDMQGEAVMDTVKVLGVNDMLSDPTVMKSTLEFIRKTFPCKDYGMIVSSHSTGWLPEGYYAQAIPKSSPSALVEYTEPVVDELHPMVKTIGADHYIRNGRLYTHEMELHELRIAIPMHLSYLFFDACLMGGIEVAYSLKDVADVIGFSQTEVLANGLDYTKLASHLLEGNEPDLKSVCSDYFDYYMDRTGVYQSATYSLIRTGNLKEIADICKPLFEKYRAQISTLDPYTVQQYYRADRHWFYDMEDILVQAGADAEELAELDRALDKCIIYKASTPWFMSEFEIRTYCGFSMFLPSDGSSYLKGLYSYLDWNKATGLVK